MGTKSQREDICLWMWSLPVGLRMSGLQGGRGSQLAIKHKSRYVSLSKVRIREEQKPKDERLAMVKLWGQHIKGLEKRQLKTL